MQTLKTILKKARPQIDWFGMGEAVRLVQEIDKIDKETDVADLARRAVTFLQFRSIDNAANLAEELKVALEKKELIHGKPKHG